MTVQSSVGKVGSKIIKTKWPVTEGLILGTTKLPEKIAEQEPDIIDVTKEERKLIY